MDMRADGETFGRFEAPKDWHSRSLSTIATKIADGEHLTPRRARQGYLLLSARNVLDGRLDLDDVDYVGPEEYARIRRRCDPNEGDILISCSGSIGRIALVPPGLECVMVRSAAFVRLDTAVANAAFVQYYLQSAAGQLQIANSLNQGAQANLFLGPIGSLRIALPPLAEQRAIAAALSDVDALLDALDRLIAKKHDLKQAAMQQLLTGQARLPGFSGNWKRTRLGDVGSWRGGLTPSMANSSFWEGGDIPWASSGDIKTPILKRTALSVTRAAVRATGLSILPVGTVVVVTRSGILRRHLPVSRTATPLVVNQDIKSLVAGAGNSSEFLYHLFVFSGPAILASCLKAGTTVESIEFPWLRRFEVKLPGLDEQCALAAVLSDMDAEITALEQRRDKTRLLKQGMMQELLTGRTRLV